MWPARKPINRRLGRVHVLDVKLRSDQVRQSRMRWGMLAVSVILGMGCGLYVLWRAGDWALDQMVYQNPAFAIQKVDVQTDGVIPEAQLRRWAKVKDGENLLALDLVRVKRNLERVPFIASVSVERILPRTLRVRVTEREAVAQVEVTRPRPGGGVDVRVFHLDPEGFVMPPIGPRPRTKPPGSTDDSLPMLTGLALPDLQLGRRLDSAQVAAGLHLISEFACSPMAGLVELRRIDLSASDVMVVTTGQGSEVTFGLPEVDRQLRRWREIHDQLQQRKSSLVSLDLAVPNNIPMRYLEGNPPPTPAPKPPKPLRNKKSHV
jgi:cell division septal protein FtsQ